MAFTIGTADLLVVFQIFTLANMGSESTIGFIGDIMIVRLFMIALLAANHLIEWQPMVRFRPFLLFRNYWCLVDMAAVLGD